MNISIRRVCVLLALAAILALAGVAALADESRTLWLYPGAGTGGDISVDYAQGEDIAAPECPDSFVSPSPYHHFGGWVSTSSSPSVYYQPGDAITMNANVTLSARWYLDQEYHFEGTLDNGMAWEMYIAVGDSSGNVLEDETYGNGNNRRYLRSGWLNITGSGDMPDFAGQYSAPWDSILYALWHGGNGLNNRDISHSDAGGRPCPS